VAAAALTGGGWSRGSWLCSARVVRRRKSHERVAHPVGLSKRRHQWLLEAISLSTLPHRPLRRRGRAVSRKHCLPRCIASIDIHTHSFCWPVYATATGATIPLSGPRLFPPFLSFPTLSSLECVATVAVAGFLPDDLIRAREATAGEQSANGRREGGGGRGRGRRRYLRD